jgi:hypothetical protein
MKFSPVQKLTKMASIILISLRMACGSIDRAAALAAGDSLSLNHDLQNLDDPEALLLHTEDRLVV